MTLSARLNLLITAIGTNIKTLFTDLAAHKTATGAHIASKINLDSDVIIPIESDALPETNPSNYTATTVDEAIDAIGTTIRVSKLQKPYTIVPSAASLPATSLGKVIYITADTGTVYFWSTTNSEYISVTGASSSTFPFIAFGFDSETPSQAQALGYLTVSIGHNAGLDNPSNDDINIGTNAGRGVAHGGEGIYIGKDAGWGSYGERSVILGRNALKGNGLPNAAAATQSVAIGDEAAIGADLFNSVVIGMQAGVLAADNSSVIIGYRSNWGKGSDSCVYIGREVIGATPGENLTQAFGAVGIGYKAHPKSRDDVALGSYSTTDEVTTVTPSYVIRGTTYTFANGATNPTTSVSFGTVDMKRPILNLAAGRISETSTDAVNGSQLHAVITAVNAMGDSVNVSTDSNIDGGEPSTVYGGTLLVDGGTP